MDAATAGLLGALIGATASVLSGWLSSRAQGQARKESQEIHKQQRKDEWRAQLMPHASEFISYVRGMHDIHVHAEDRRPHMREPYHFGQELSPERIRWSGLYFEANRNLHASKAKLQILIGDQGSLAQDLNAAIEDAVDCAKSLDEKIVDAACEKTRNLARSIYHSV